MCFKSLVHMRVRVCVCVCVCVCAARHRMRRRGMQKCVPPGVLTCRGGRPKAAAARRFLKEKSAAMIGCGFGVGVGKVCACAREPSAHAASGERPSEKTNLGSRAWSERGEAARREGVGVCVCLCV